MHNNQEETAVAKFKDGFNCAQSVLLEFAYSLNWMKKRL
jgi:hypothetical protein